VIENLPAPALAVQALFGERADVVLASTRLEPQATLASGYRFGFETVEPPHTAEELWPFFCNANNLEEITPPFLAFRVLGMSTPGIGAGTRIDYRLRLNGIPVAWRSRIEDWEPPRRFVDLQERGPYALWHHTHEFVPLAGGTLMRDTVRYRLPAGWLGALAGGPRVDTDVGRIFDYRARMIDARFGTRGAGTDTGAGAGAGAG